MSGVRLGTVVDPGAARAAWGAMTDIAPVSGATGGLLRFAARDAAGTQVALTLHPALARLGRSDGTGFQIAPRDTLTGTAEEVRAAFETPGPVFYQVAVLLADGERAGLDADLDRLAADRPDLSARVHPLTGMGFARGSTFRLPGGNPWALPDWTHQTLDVSIPFDRDQADQAAAVEALDRRLASRFAPATMESLDAMGHVRPVGGVDVVAGRALAWCGGAPDRALDAIKGMTARAGWRAVRLVPA